MNKINPHLTPSGRDINQIRQEVQRARANKVQFPDGHIIAVAHAKVFGPRNATTPEGHPITIGSGLFDLTVETPQHAIARAAKRWFGIEIHEPHWEIAFEADVVIPPGHPLTTSVKFSKLFHLKYLHEAHKWVDRGLDHNMVHNHFRESWYLKIKEASK